MQYDILDRKTLKKRTMNFHKIIMYFVFLFDSNEISFRKCEKNISPIKRHAYIIPQRSISYQIKNIVQFLLRIIN